MPKSLKTTLIAAAVALLSLQPLATMQPASAATATKTAASATIGSTTQVQIRLQAPASATRTVEVSFVLDASGSMHADMATAKTQIRNFVNWVWDNGAAPRTTISVSSFGYEACADVNSWDPHLSTPVNRRVMTTATHRTEILNLINSINSTPSCDGVYYGFSDIAAGLRHGSGRLATSTANDKFLVLLSDGFQNMPTGSGNYNGTCPLGISGPNRDHRNYTIPLNWTQFMVIRSASAQNSEALPRIIYSVPGYGNLTASCSGYLTDLQWHGGPSSITGNQLLQRMVTYYEHGTSESITTAIDKIKGAAVNNIYISDYLNTDVFTTGAGTISGVMVHSCPTASTYSTNLTASSNLLVSNNQIVGSIPYTSGVAYYCIRFTATLRPDAPSGSQPINSADSQPANCNTVFGGNNFIRYRDANNVVIGCDLINLGSIALTGGDLRVDAFNLRTASNVESRVYNVNEQIHVLGTFSNPGTVTVASGTVTAFYKNQAAAAAANSPISDIPMYIYNHGGLPAGQSRTYNSTEGAAWANSQSSTSPTSLSTAKPYRFTQAAASNYTARMFANYTGSVTEASYPANNQASYNYSVITQPTGLTSATPTCTSATLSWSGGSSNITGYTLRYTPAGGSVVSRTISTTSPTTITGLAGDTAFTWSLQAQTINGSSPQQITGQAFTTPPCRSFDTAAPTGTIIHPGGEAGSQNINITYRPNVAAWGAFQLTVAVVGIVPGTNDCSAYNATTSPTVSSASGVTADVAHLAGIQGEATFAANSRNSVVFELTAAESTPQGVYTLCIASSSASGAANNPIVATTFEVRHVSWLQVTSNASSVSTGDVHSNGNVALSIPFGKYFFGSGAGVISASSSSNAGLGISSNKLTDTAQWRVATYSPPVLTPGYQDFFKSAQRSSGNNFYVVNPASNGTGVPNSSNLCMYSKQNTGGGSPRPIHVRGNMRLIATVMINDAGGHCTNTPLIIFVDGNLEVAQGQLDFSNNTGVVYIVNGDVTVSPTVSRTDGIYMFGGRFSDGGGNQPLTINGSLIGLSGQTPTATTGSFQNGSQSGILRDLQNGNENPANTINYQPKYLELIRSRLGSSTLSWSE